jgi:hypothetical protein
MPAALTRQEKFRRLLERAARRARLAYEASWAAEKEARELAELAKGLSFGNPEVAKFVEEEAARVLTRATAASTETYDASARLRGFAELAGIGLP